MRQPQFDPVLFPNVLPGSGWGPWPLEASDTAFDGPGLLVSRAFWIGGGLSLALWGAATWLVLTFV